MIGSPADDPLVPPDPRVGVILDIVATETFVDRARLVPEARIASLDIASLDMVQAIFALESRFDVEIPVAVDQGSGEFDTVDALVKHVLAAIDSKAAGAVPAASKAVG